MFRKLILVSAVLLVACGPVVAERPPAEKRTSRDREASREALPAPESANRDTAGPLKLFILAGQSNMVGWGDSTKLPADLRDGSDRVLMFEAGKWQRLRPHQEINRGQRRVGLTQFAFGPEIAFGHALAKAWPDETIGIVKLAVGGTSILTWKPDWSKKDADRVGQGRLGSLYKKLMAKVDQARKARDVEIAGFLWLQGGGDMRHPAVAKEYLNHLASLVAAVRKDTGVPDLPFYCGSSRNPRYPDDLSDFTPKLVEGRYPAVEFVLKAQWDAQTTIPRARTVLLRDIAKYPMNVHYNTVGQLKVGKLFAAAVLDSPSRLGGHTPQRILTMLGAKGSDGVTGRQLEMYRRIFGFIDANGDGKHTRQEFVEKGRYLTRRARQGIFRASDANGDGVVSETEYVENRIITDEAKAIFDELDTDNDGRLTAKELSDSAGFNDQQLAEAVFTAWDSDGDREVELPEYLRTWGEWARRARGTGVAASP